MVCCANGLCSLLGRQPIQRWPALLQTYCPILIRQGVTMQVPYSINSVHHSDVRGFTALLGMALDLHTIPDESTSTKGHPIPWCCWQGRCSMVLYKLLS